jgi:hypothetical protein
MTDGLRAFYAVAMVVLTGCTGDARIGEIAQPLFTRVPSTRTGITFANELPENPVRNGFTYEYYYNGAGVAVGDLNGDDLPELYFTANMGPNRLYLNRGDFLFEDVTERAGVVGLRGGWATGVTFADVNGDGLLDIYVSQSGPFGDDDLRRNLLYINQGERDGIPFYIDQAAQWGVDDAGLSTQAAFFDFDGDGDLDMYLMNHGVPGYRTIEAMRAGRSRAEVDRLYRNDGDRFVDVSDAAGLIDTNLGFGLGVSVGDLNNDGRPDIYVANDYSGRDYLYLGRPDGTFEETLTRSMGHVPLASMGSDIADIDGDGWLDVVVLEMAMTSHYARKIAERGTESAQFTQLVREGQHYQYQANALQWNRGVSPAGVPVFSDIAHLAGVARTDWSWAPLFADFDNDGMVDLFVSNGMAGGTMNADFDDYKAQRIAHAQEAEGRVPHSVLVELLEDLPRQKVANHVYRNEGDLTFSDRSVEWGLSEPSYSQGAVWADLDGDGDLDLVISNLMDEAFVYRNNARELTDAHFVRVRMEGGAGNRFGVGARVQVRAGGRQQVQELQLTRGYVSSVEPVLHFGLGAHSVIDTLEVLWPDGSLETRTAVPADGSIVFRHRDAQSRTGGDRSNRSRPLLFLDATVEIRPLPPRHTVPATLADATLEPYPSQDELAALAVGDVNGDGLDDFVWGGTVGDPVRVFVQAADGSFNGTTVLRGGTSTRTLATAIFDADGDTAADVWIVTTNRSSDSPQQRHLLFQNTGNGSFRQTEPAIDVAASHDGVTLAPADFDGDGRIDLFIGNRAVPGVQPTPGSRLLRNERGGFRDVTADVAPALDELRTVTDALWADVDGSGTLDLVVVGEWMPVTLLLNDGQQLRDTSAEAGLVQLTGWWQSVAMADFDRDGDLDLVAGNVGRNHPYRPDTVMPFELHVADFDGDGSDEAIPAYHESGQLFPWYGRTRMGEIVDGVIDRYGTYDAYARQSLSAILGVGPLSSARRLTAATFETTYFENADGRFVVHPLPPAAQISAVNGIAPADYDGDGVLDVVIAGNLHALDPSVPRLDGGVGLFLRGDGSGRFEPVQPYENGVWLDGNVRILALLRLGPGAGPGLLAGLAGGGLAYLRTASRR